MTRFAILFMTLVLVNKLLASAPPNGIQGSDIPKMRTGFSLNTTNTEDFARACQSLISSRFTNATENTDDIYARIQYTAAQLIKPKLSPTLRDSAPDELILASGFTTSDQDSLEMAGCYIRLGINLRTVGLNNLAATSFLNNGTLFADASRACESDDKVDLLISAAQSYSWAYYNEPVPLRKDTLKTITMNYLLAATSAAQILTTENKNSWILKIARQRAKL